MRGLPVPLWFLQLGDQGLSDWGLLGDPPILTEHVDAQFGWMFALKGALPVPEEGMTVQKNMLPGGGKTAITVMRNK